ncbi:Esterase AAEL000016,Esterase OVCA2 [Mytilus coruscus]|uniref:Esterase AAEL000016,Esterase OVCA2 n=1 Tax=Mytilus coruscus TaxID=42192 RepID=A0A6J8C8C4_MYTCO|nr:Esterase AAEL000016,Esterase OVCA2 [Mytilus coruscus]
MSNEQPLKILCIHGYRQNGQVFRERTGAFRKIIKKHADLVFITAPNRVPPLERDGGAADSTVDTDARGWWFSRGEDNYYNPLDYTDSSKGFEDSLKCIIQTFQEQGPFDGIVAFTSPIKFDFAIFVSGFKSRQKEHGRFYDVTIEIPTLHVFGETDQVIAKEMSEDLLQCYKEPMVLQHAGGHFIPASSAQKKKYVEFLDLMIARKK